MAVADSWQALQDALAALEGVWVYTDPGATITPPAVVMGLPTLGWTAYNSDGPDQYSSRLILVVDQTEHAANALITLLDQVDAVIQAHSDFTVMHAEPNMLSVSGAGDLPAYVLTVEG